MKQDFKFVLDWGGRPSAARRLREHGINRDFHRAMYNWVRRGSVPADVIQAVLKIKSTSGEAISDQDFELVAQENPAVSKAA